MFHIKSRYVKICITIIITFFFNGLIAQDNIHEDFIKAKFDIYSDLPREIAYVHLNKSVFISGEDIGFTAYVFDKKDLKLSNLSSNLYCIIQDEKNRVVQQKLMKVVNGIAHGSFSIDSVYNPGKYKFIAYSNWMLNFTEKNYYTQYIEILGQEESLETVHKDNIDIQFLPEGGHMLYGVENTVAVVAKDANGHGLPYLNGELFEDGSGVISTFKLNKHGLGRYSFTPDSSKHYSVKIFLDRGTEKYEINNIDQKGIVMSLKSLTGKVILSFKTNELTRKDINQELYTLAIHDGVSITTTKFHFGKETSITKVISDTKLSPGINIFTVFNDENKPLLERMYFNYEGISILESERLDISEQRDSIKLSLDYPININTLYNNVSVSILPISTLSYNHHDNIISSTLLRPFIRSSFENAKYYFQDIDREKKYDLDNLLLSQGWSSYSWNKIFNNPPNSYYAFEQGIGFIANLNSFDSKTFIIYPFGGKRVEYIKREPDELTFQLSGYFPVENEMISISQLDKNGNLKPAILNLQFFPSFYPKFNHKTSDISYNKVNPISKSPIETIDYQTVNNLQILDEIVITAASQKTRIEILRSKKPYGKIDEFDDLSRGKNQSLTDYLRQKGYNVYDEQGNFSILNSDARTFTSTGPPTFYIDDAQVFDLSMLSNYDMDYIDYIEFNKNGIGEGIRGGNGVIKIYTLSILERNRIEKNDKTVSVFKIPLTFEEPDKLYYVPKYRDLESPFFEKHGIINWYPINRIIKNRLELNMALPAGIKSFKLFIEGITSDGKFISETVEVIR